MTQSVPPTRRNRARAYSAALVGVVLIGGLYLWANTGPADGPGDRNARGLGSSAPVQASPPPQR